MKSQPQPASVPQTEPLAVPLRPTRFSEQKFWEEVFIAAIRKDFPSADSFADVALAEWLKRWAAPAASNGDPMAPPPSLSTSTRSASEQFEANAAPYADTELDLDSATGKARR